MDSQVTADGSLDASNYTATSGVIPPDLLEGLAGDARHDRAELIDWLLDRGFTFQQIRRSSVPIVLPANRVMGDDGVYVSERQVAQSAGIELGTLRRLARAVGLPRIDDPDAAVLHRVDAEATAAAKFFLDLGLDIDETVAVIRVLVEGLSHTIAILRETGFKLWSKPGATELELAQAAEVLASREARQVESIVSGLLLMQMRRTYETDGLSAAERATGTPPAARSVAVAFADLSGFTRLGETLSPEELTDIVSRLSDLAHDVVYEPVRFVKIIGDAVMFVSPEPQALVDNVLALLDDAAAAGLPELRAGIALGTAVSRAGDWFGSAVNTASRISDLASPGSVLAAAPVRSAIGAVPEIRWESIGSHQLRGLPKEVELFRVRRTATVRQPN